METIKSIHKISPPKITRNGGRIHKGWLVRLLKGEIQSDWHKLSATQILPRSGGYNTNKISLVYNSVMHILIISLKHDFKRHLRRETRFFQLTPIKGNDLFSWRGFHGNERNAPLFDIIKRKNKNMWYEPRSLQEMYDWLKVESGQPFSQQRVGKEWAH